MSLSCIICYEEIEENNTATLPCGHIFDRQCIKQWLGGSRMCPICRHRCCQEYIIFLYNVNNKECDCSHNHHNRINNIEKLLLDMETEITQKRYDKEQQYESKLKTHSDYICSIEQRYSELIQWSNEQGQTILSLQKEITELLIQEQRYGSKLKTQSDYIRSIETRYNELIQAFNEQGQTISSLQKELRKSQQQFQIDLEHKQQVFNNLATLYIILMTILYFA